MTELYRNDYMVAELEGDLLRLAWHREEPGDEHATRTAQAVVAELDRRVAGDPTARLRILLDLVIVGRTFPRATATYAAWLLSHRAQVKGGAFCTRSFLLRAAVSAALLVPGLHMKGFKDLDDARAFLAGL